MTMTEFELYNRILAKNFRAKEQNRLKETKCPKPQTAKVNDQAIDDYINYRFDLEEKEFLPFFNNDNTGKDKSPKSLRAFCDYIILAVMGNKLYVVLVEMKSGKNDGATGQLEATETFMEYIKQTALRIKDANGYGDFDGKKVILRKLKLKPSMVRPLTNTGKSKGNKTNLFSDPMIYEGNFLPLARLCNPHGHMK